MSKLRAVARRVSAQKGKAAYAMRRWRSGVLVTSGLGSFAVAGFIYSTLVGFVVMGACLLVLELCTKEVK